MSKSTFVAVAAIAMMLAILPGCATSGPEYEASAFHRFVKAIDTECPLRQGIIENGNDFAIDIYIDGELKGHISQKYYGYFQVTAKEEHVLAVRDSRGRTVRPDKKFIIPDSPLGSHYRIPPRRVKIIDTGWIQYI